MFFQKRDVKFPRRSFFPKNNWGLSTIVVTLILIVLSLVAIGAIWVIVSGVIKTGSANADVSGFMINLRITRVVSTGDNLSVTVQRDPGKGQMSKIKFVVSDGVNSEVVTRNASIEELASQTFSFPLAQMSLTNVKTVSISPVFVSQKGEETTGQLTDTFTVSGIVNGEYSGSGSNNNTNPLICASGCTGTDTCINGVCVPQDCIPELTGLTCGTWVCGSRINNCGQNVSCGIPCSGGTECSNGVCTIPYSCNPDCAGRECGLDLICGISCGVCSGSDQCINSICVVQNCIPESAATTCGAWTCGNKTNNCGETVSCGVNCASGTLCLNGNCTLIYPINTGIVEDIWPGTSGLYFGSNNLSKTITYENKYIKFPGSSETRCLIIAISRLPIEGYSKSHIGFNFETDIISGDHYQIWPNLQYCNA